MSSRRELVYYIFRLHNRNNKKLSCKIITAKNMKIKYNFYESFRASKCGKNQRKVPKQTKIVISDDWNALDKKQRKLLKSKFGKRNRV